MLRGLSRFRIAFPLSCSTSQLLNHKSLFGFVMSSKVETSRFSFLNHDQRFLDYARNEQSAHNKKTGRKINSPPGVEVRVVTPKAFGAVNQAWGVNASFSSLIFSLLLFSSSPSTNSPLSSATRAELCEELGMTSLIRVQLIVTFFLSNIFVANFENIFTSSRAIILFGAREIFSFSPFRNKIVTSFASLSIPEFAPLTSFATMMSQSFSRSFFAAFSST